MHTRTVLLLATSLSLVAQTTLAQTPGPSPEGASAPVLAPLAPSGTAPPPWSASPPEARWLGPAPAQAPAVLPPPAPPLAPLETPPLQLKGRVGFGIGLWGAPGGAGSQVGQGELGALGTLFGGALGLRWWASERIVLLPALHVGVSRMSIPDATDGAGNKLPGGNFTAGTFSPKLSLGFAAYRGKSTRLLLSGGLSFGYSAQQTLSQTLGDDGAYHARYQTAKMIGVSVPVGLSLEQFFTPRLSGVLGAESPLFGYSSSKIGDQAPVTLLGADFSSTRLGASIVFYTD